MGVVYEGVCSDGVRLGGGEVDGWLHGASECPSSGACTPYYAVIEIDTNFSSAGYCARCGVVARPVVSEKRMAAQWVTGGPCRLID